MELSWRQRRLASYAAPSWELAHLMTSLVAWVSIKTSVHPLFASKNFTRSLSVPASHVSQNSRVERFFL